MSRQGSETVLLAPIRVRREGQNRRLLFDCKSHLHSALRPQELVISRASECLEACPEEPSSLLVSGGMGGQKNSTDAALPAAPISAVCAQNWKFPR